MAVQAARRQPSIRTLWGIAKSPELGLTDEDLYALVYRETGKDSLRALSQGELNKVVRLLQGMKDSAGRNSGRRRTDEGGNTGTVALRRKLFRLMKDLGWTEAQVNGMARRMFQIERIEWLDPGQCGKLIEALKAIHARQEVAKSQAEGRT